MYLVQLLLPIEGKQGQPVERAVFQRLEEQLTTQFGRLTAYTRAPATGLWEAESGRKVRDQVVVYEVMVEHLELPWWALLRRRLEHELDQDEVVVRAQTIQRL